MRLWLAHACIALGAVVPAAQAQPKVGGVVAPTGAPAAPLVPGDRFAVPPRPELQAPPFRLGFAFSQVFNEKGDLAVPGQSSSALGLDFSFREGHAVRKHIQLAHQWESLGNVTRKGFRLDLIDLGFPIPVFSRAAYVQIEPLLRLFRGQMLFESVDGGKSHMVFRLESGFATQIVVGFDRWFLTVQPLSVDFRYAAGTADDATSGFATVWSYQLMVGSEF